IEKGKAYFLIKGSVANNLGQSLLSDFFVVPMNLQGGLANKPFAFEDFIQQYQLNEELHTMHISDEELQLLKDLFPDAIESGHKKHMNQQQQQLRYRMEKELAVYEEKIKQWKQSKNDQLELNFGDKPNYGFIQKKREDKIYEIETIANSSSQYFKDLTSLNGNPYLKVLAVFFNN